MAINVRATLMARFRYINGITPYIYYYQSLLKIKRGLRLMDNTHAT